MNDESKMGLFARTDPESVAKAKAANSAGGKKGAVTRRNRKELAAMLENMGEVRSGAIETFLFKNPEAFNDLYAMLFSKALGGERWAAELVINSTGLAAPKQTEVTNKEEEMETDTLIAKLMEKQNGQA